MDKHYQLFKDNLSWIQMDFKKLLETQSFINNTPFDKKSVDAKKVAIMMEKYLDQSPNMLYQILTRNLGKNNVTWDDLLKCLQDEFNLSYTVLKRQSKSFSISQAKWNLNSQYKKVIQYLKLKQTNYIQNIIKPSLGFNISQVSSQCDILAVLLEKELLFYLIQEDRIVSVMEFKYRNVKNKLLKKHNHLENKKNQARKNHQSIDYMPLQDSINNKDQNKMNNSKKTQNKYDNNIRESNRLAQSEDITPSAQSRMQQRSRLNSNASSDLSTFMKRYQTDAGVSDWKKKKSHPKRENSVKIRTNTTKKVFELFQTAKLQNSIEIARKFQQSRNSFQQYMILDKKLLEKQPKTQLQEVTIERHTFDFKSQLQKMKLTAKLMPKYKKSCSFFGTNNDKQNNNIDLYFKSLQKNKLSENLLMKTKTVDKMNFEKHKSQLKNKSSDVIPTDTFHDIDGPSNDKNESNKLLQDNKIGVVSYSFYQNLFLVSLYNRQVRLYRIKKNLHRIKEELVFQKHNQSLITYVQIYKAIFAQTYNMILCSNRPNEGSVIKIYEISKQKILSSVIDDEEDTSENRETKSKQIFVQNNQFGKDFKEIFHCRLSFDPIYQNLSPLGIGAFNQRGHLALIETNNISGDCQNKSEKKIFEKQFYNTVTGQVISFVACKVHSNMINLYLLCKGGFIYFVDKLTAKIKLLRKLSQYKLLDLQMIKESTQILAVSQKGQLLIVNSQNLEPMFFLETYMGLNEQSRLLKLTQSRYMFYSPRGIKMIDLTENEEKLLEYQKPLKIYRNRIKIKKQQALLSKETNEIENKKYQLQKISSSQFETESLHSKKQGNSMGIELVVRESKMEKFQSKLNKRKIQQFYEVSNVQNPHYIMVLQNGEILVYNSKGEYYGSYLKNRGLETVLCVMNKKLHYLGILYSNNKVQIINLYSQMCVLDLPVEKSDEQELKMLKSVKVMGGSRKQVTEGDKQDQEIIIVGFVQITSGNTNNNKTQPGSNSNSQQLIFTIDKSFTLNLMSFKGIKTKSILLNNLYISTNLRTSKSIANCTYWDKSGQLLIGTHKGQILFYQKNTLEYHKSIKLSPYPIVKIQPLTHNSKQKHKLNYILSINSNNEIYLIDKHNTLFKKIFQPNQHIQKQQLIRFQSLSNLKPNTKNKSRPISITSKSRPSSIQSKQRQRYSLLHNKQSSLNKKQLQKQLIDTQGKVSSVHYFSKIITFTQYFAVYEWQQIYQKPLNIHSHSDQKDFQQSIKDQPITLKKTLQSIIHISHNKGDSINNHQQPKKELKQYKTKGYLVEKLPKIQDIESQLKQKSMTKQQKMTENPITHNNQSQESLFNNPNFYFLKIYSTEDQFHNTQNIPSRSYGIDSQQLNFTQTLIKPYEINCYTESTKLTVIIEPQSQFRNVHFNSKFNPKNQTNNQTSNQTNNQTSNYSLINSSFNSRKNSFDSTNSKNISFNQNSFNINKNTPKKTIIKVYDLEYFLKSNQNFNSSKNDVPFKILLEQEI